MYTYLVSIGTECDMGKCMVCIINIIFMQLDIIIRKFKMINNTELIACIDPYTQTYNYTRLQR